MLWYGRFPLAAHPRCPRCCGRSVSYDCPGAVGADSERPISGGFDECFGCSDASDCVGALVSELVYIANSVAMRCQKALLKAAYDSYNFTGLRVRSVELV